MSDTKRYVLFRPGDVGGDVDVAAIHPKVRVVDSIGGRGYLVEAPAEAIERVRQRLAGWTIEEERLHPPPETF